MAGILTVEMAHPAASDACLGLQLQFNVGGGACASMAGDPQGANFPMRFSLLILVVSLGSLVAAAQSSSSQPATQKPADAQQKDSDAKATPRANSPAAKSEGAGSKEVAPNATVITIKGLCSAPVSKTATTKTAATKASGSAAAQSASCETLITKKQLDAVIEAVRPNLPAPQRRMLAQQYVELLTMANAASKAGLEKDPEVQEKLRLAKLQVLAQSYTRDMQKKDSEVPQADLEKYYKDNASKYEQAKLLRIYIPIVTAEGKPPDTAATKLIAEKIQQRAAAGEDFDKLQKDAFAVAENKGTPPSVDMGERRRGTLPPKQEDAVFALKPGAVSPALEETSGFYIYKIVSKEQLPLDRVRDEIKGILSRERFRDQMEKTRTSVQPTFNDAYFGGPSSPASGGETGAVPHGPSTPVPAAPSAAPGQSASPAPSVQSAPPSSSAPSNSATPQAPNVSPAAPPK